MRQSSLFLAVEDLGFSHHRGAVFKLRLQLDVSGGHRQHPAGNGQHLTHAADRHIEGGRDTVQRRQEQVAEALPRQCSLRETVVQHLPHHRLRVGQGLDAVADVTGRRHPQVLAEHAAAAAVVRHRDNGGNVLRVLL